MENQKKTYRCNACGATVKTARRRRACYKRQRNAQGFLTGWRCPGKMIRQAEPKPVKRAKRSAPTLEQRHARAARAAKRHEAAALRAQTLWRKWTREAHRIERLIAKQRSVIQLAKSRNRAIDLDDGEN